jgi:hypothetical protein
MRIQSLLATVVFALMSIVVSSTSAITELSKAQVSETRRTLIHPSLEHANEDQRGDAVSQIDAQGFRRLEQCRLSAVQAVVPEHRSHVHESVHAKKHVQRQEYQPRKSAAECVQACAAPGNRP